MSRVILHENYDYRTLDNDIALIRLSSPVKMSRTTSLICLPASIGCSKSRLNIGHKGFATGWGERQNLATGFNRRMKAIGLYVANKTECEYRLKQKHGKFSCTCLIAIEELLTKFTIFTFYCLYAYNVFQRYIMLSRFYYLATRNKLLFSFSFSYSQHKFNLLAANIHKSISLEFVF